MKRLLIIFIGTVAMAQNINLIPISSEEATSLSAAYKAYTDARQAAEDKSNAYYALSRRVQKAHKISDCSAFTKDFRWAVEGAANYNSTGLITSAGTVTSASCRY